MQVISGPIGKERVHYEAPKTDRFDAEMRTLLNWFEPAKRVIRVALPVSG
jgi:hypothetical protein